MWKQLDIISNEFSCSARKAAFRFFSLFPLLITYSNKNWSIYLNIIIIKDTGSEIIGYSNKTFVVYKQYTEEEILLTEMYKNHLNPLFLTSPLDHVPFCQVDQQYAISNNLTI